MHWRLACSIIKGYEQVKPPAPPGSIIKERAKTIRLESQKHHPAAVTTFRTSNVDYYRLDRLSLTAILQTIKEATIALP
jgi:hypothetical protein